MSRTTPPKVVKAFTTEPVEIPEGDDSLDEVVEEFTDGAEPITLKLSDDACGVRLDKVLSGLVPQYSRSRIQQWIEGGHVTVDGNPARTKMTVLGDEVVVITPQAAPEDNAFQPEPMDLRIVHEDKAIMVIDKPAGLVVHPAAGNWSGTLLNGLLHHCPALAGVPRAGIVHRLDKDTSGLMVVARSRAAMDALVAMIAARDVSRQYLALAHKAWGPRKRREVDAPIGRDPRNRLRMAVVDLAQHAGKTARTDIDLLAGNEEVSLVRCTLHTGRTHQIRVHMASLGHPLVADAVYGGKEAGGMARQALHAFRLAFTHPMTGQALVLRAPLPPDMAQALENWGLSYNPAESL